MCASEVSNLIVKRLEASCTDSTGKICYAGICGGLQVNLFYALMYLETANAEIYNKLIENMK